VLVSEARLLASVRLLTQPVEPEDSLTLLLDGTDLMGLGRCEHVDFLGRLVWWSGCQDVSDATVGELSELA
jgi:hypothetical protein